ncbi:MAG: glycosyl hydrolase 53 family protein [Candidatus Promineifilaceae bacterium]
MFNRKSNSLLVVIFGSIFLATLILIGCMGFTPNAAQAQEGNLVVNPSFEDDGIGMSDPTGWTSIGDVSADFTESGGRTGDFKLSHWRADSYTVATTQTISGLNNGQYLFSLWYKSGGGQNEAYAALRDCGSPEVQIPLPQTDASTWEQVEGSIEVTNGQCTIVLYSDANANNWANFDDVEFIDALAPTPMPSPTPNPETLGQRGAPLTIRGADVSSLDKSEVMGGVYNYQNGKQGDALEILEHNGLNYIRLRVWVNPADGYNTKERILPMAQHAKDLGMGVLIDFHYSDFWADPGRQDKPAAWADYDLDQLQTAVYDHTYDVCSALVAQGTPPDMVQIGNEINNGMLWPDGGLAKYDWGYFGDLAKLLKSGVQAMDDCSPDTKIMLHNAEAGNYGHQEWWYSNIIDEGVPFDVIGLSYYPFWHGTLENLQSSLNDLAARFDKDIVLVEFSYPFTLDSNDQIENVVHDPSQLTPGFPATPEGQQVMTRRIMNVVRQIPDGHGLGVFYWDATWTAVEGNGWDPTDPTSGNGWENQALFDFNNAPLPALLEFQGRQAHAGNNGGGK